MWGISITDLFPAILTHLLCVRLCCHCVVLSKQRLKFKCTKCVHCTFKKNDLPKCKLKSKKCIVIPTLDPQLSNEGRKMLTFVHIVQKCLNIPSQTGYKLHFKLSIWLLFIYWLSYSICITMLHHSADVTDRKT